MLKITHKAVGIITILGVSACMLEIPTSQQPSNTIKQLRLFRMQKMAYYSNTTAFCTHLAQWERIVGYTQSDVNLTRKYLRTQLKFSKRDADLISKQGDIIGTGMTARALDCSADIKSINKSFYRYSGHHWQAVVWGGSYVYLEGNGTDTGMKVTGWN